MMRTKPSKIAPNTRQLFIFLTSILLLLSAACSRTDAGSPEAVADAFANAYFKLADQEAAKRYTAFGASKMLEMELADVKKVRETGFTPSDAKLDVALKRGARTERGQRVGFAYTLRYSSADVTKYAMMELSKVHDEWKVVVVTLSNEPPPTEP